MRRAFIVLAVAAAGTFVAASPGVTPPARTFSLRATLTVGQEVPRPSATLGGRGLLTATLTPTASGATIVWRLTFTKLTGQATAASIRRGEPGHTGPLLARLCAPCRSGAHGTVRVSGQPARHAILFGETYVNVATKRNPRGEIRGQIPKVSPGYAYAG